MNIQTLLYNVTYISAIAGIIVTSLVILIRNNTVRYRAFGIFAGLVGVWVTLQLIAQLVYDDYNLALTLIRVATATSNIMAYTFLLFALTYRKHSVKIKQTWYLLLLPLILLPLSFTDLSVRTIEVDASGIAITDAGLVYSLQLLMIAVYFVSSVIYIYLKTRASSAEEKRRVKILLFAIAQVVVVTILGSVLFGQYKLSQLIVPITSSIMVAMIGYAIVRHKLFDIRSFVFKALVYTLTTLFIGATYTLVVYGVAAIFVDVSNISIMQEILFLGLALMVAITYAPLIRFFNRITTRVFFRDAYETQQVLDQIGKIVVGSIDLHKIEKASLKALSDAIKPTYIGFVMRNNSGTIGAQDFVGQKPDLKIEQVRDLVEATGRKQTLYDELNQSSDVATRMRESDITTMTPLITKDETIGYLISGPKKSGDVYNAQDVGLLGIAANELAVALQNAQRFEEIQVFNITLQEKVNEATRELKSTNKKLVALDEAKDEFISMASHQLRTPLTSIKGYLSMILDGDMGKLNKNQTQALKEAFGSSQRMVFLISDFLNVSRIKTGKFVIEPKEINLAEMVGEEIKQLTEMAEARDITLKYEQPAEFPMVKLDDNKMRQVMMNMVDNAIYYTPAGGTVTIRLLVDGSDVVFKVIDTGIGVPKSEQHKLFTKFFRAGNAKVARPDGTGLGLFMAQKIIVAQNGSIIFESEEGKGSTFGFRFPLKSIKA